MGAGQQIGTLMTASMKLVKLKKVKFIYSEKSTKFCEIFTLLLSYAVPVKSKVKISQNFVAFSENMNFKKNCRFCNVSLLNTNLVLFIWIRYQINWIISKVFFSFFLASNKLLAPLRSEIGTCLVFRCQFSVLDNANTI